MRFRIGKKVKIPKMLHYLTKLIRAIKAKLKSFVFIAKNPRHFVRNCLKKKSDEKQKAN